MIVDGITYSILEIHSLIDTKFLISLPIKIKNLFNYIKV